MPTPSADATPTSWGTGGVPITPGLGDPVIPISPDSPSDRIIISLGKYPLNSNPSSIVWKNLEGAFNVKYTINRSGGFGEFSATLVGKDVEAGDTLFVRRGTSVLYAGEIATLSNLENNTYEVAGSCSVLLNKNLPSLAGSSMPAQMAINRLFSVIQGKYSSNYLTVNNTVTSLATTVLISELGEGNVFDVISQLEGKLSNPLFWGITMDANLRYVLTFSELTNEVHIPLKALSYSLASETTDIPSRIVFSSTTPKYVQLLPNTNFSAGGYSGDIAFTEIDRDSTDAEKVAGIPKNSVGGAENGAITNTFVLSGGASRKAVGADGNTVVAFEENIVYELDALGERIEYTPNIIPFQLIVGRQYIISMYAKAEVSANNSNLPQITITVFWLNSGGGVISSVGFTRTSPGKFWALLETGAITCPVGAVKYRIRIETTGGTLSTSNGGIHLDRIRLRRKDEFYPNDWQLIPRGTAQIVDYSFSNPSSDRKPYDGYNFCEVEANVPSGGGNFVSLLPMSPIAVLPGRKYTWAVWLISKPGKTFPNFRVRCRFYNQTGTLISEYVSPTISLVAPTIYSRTSGEFEAPIDTVSCAFHFEQITSGAYVLGAISLRSYEETATDYYGETLRIERNASDLIPSSPFTSLLSNYGDREVLVSADSVGLVSDAEIYLKAWLTSKLLFLFSPRIQGKEVTGLTPRVDSKCYLTELQKTYPVERIAWEYEGGVLRYSAELLTKERTTEEILLGIQDRSSKLLP